jgi:hypothetical protein
MRIYPKRLNSLEELRREKQVLKYAAKHSKPDVLPDLKLNLKPGAKKVAEDAGLDSPSDILSMLGDILTSRTFTDSALAWGLPLIKLVGRKTEKSFLKTFAGEVLGGYLKWKMVQMGVRGVRLFLKMQQTKKEKEKAEKKEKAETKRHHAHH